MVLLLLIPASALGQTATEIEAAFWRSVVCERGPEVKLYLKEYPRGAYVAEAWACLEEQLGLERADRISIQRGLAAAGHDPGPADGLFGGEWARTRQAMRAWQAAKGLEARGYVTRAQADMLIALGEEAQAAAAQERREAERPRPARVATTRRPGERFRDCPTCPQMVVVPAGSYQMGSPDSVYVSGERPVHRVTIAQPFAVGVYEVTFAEWEACVRGGGCGGRRPADEGWGRGRRPVINVHWEDAQAYAEWLSRETGQAYRLLSEAE